MSTLTELNNYSNNTVTFTDNRPYGAKLTWLTSRNLSFTIETQSFTAQRSNEIDEIINPTQALVEYEIDVSTVPGTTVSWSTIPAGCSVVSSNGVFIMQGIDSVSDWQTVRAPTITIPNTFQGSFFYTSTIRYNTLQGIQESSWQVGTFAPVSAVSSTASLTVTAKRTRTTPVVLADYFSVTADLTPAGFSETSTFSFTKSTNNQAITGTPTIVYDGTPGTWNITVTPSDSSVVNSMTALGFGSTWNASTKVLTLTGNESQVETLLANILISTTSVKADFYLQYQGTVSTSAVTYSVRQQMDCLNIDYLIEPRGTASYTSNVASNIGLDGPQILDPDYTGNGLYTLKLTPAITSQVQNISSTGISGWGLEQEYTYTASSTGGLGRGAYGSTNNVFVLGNEGNDAIQTDAGSLHWFIKTGTEYSLVRSISGVGANQHLGSRIVMADDDTVISSGWGFLGSSTVNDPVGRVYVYKRYDQVTNTFTQSGTTWALKQTISQVGTVADSWFGLEISCSRDGDTLAIAEPTDTDTGENRAGSVYIYTRTGSGDYSRVRTFTDPDNDLNSSFGWGQTKLSADGTKLVISDGIGDTDTYYYTGSSNVWYFDEKISNSKRNTYFTQDGTRYIYGDGTNLYVMTRGVGSAPQSYTQTTSFTPSSTFNLNDYKVSDDGTTVVVKLVNSTSDFEFIRIDFDESTNTFTEDRTIDLASYMNTIYGWSINLDGSEIIGNGINSNGAKGFVTYTDGPKPQTFDGTAKTYTIVGTKAEINSDIDTITLTSSSITNIQLTYDVTTPESNTEDNTVIITNVG